jgi:hypothetical protein
MFNNTTTKLNNYKPTFNGTNTFTDQQIDNWDLKRSFRLQDLKKKTFDWFVEYKNVMSLLNKYEYFGTFNFDENWVKDKNFEDIQNSIKHFKSILRRKMFGKKGGFNMNLYPVIETIKYKKNFNNKKYVHVRHHVHILFGEVPDNVRLKKDFETFVIDCWMSLKESSERVGKNGQQMKKVWYENIDRCSENYIMKLRHNGNGVEWLDKVNKTEIKKQHLLDEDFCDWLERNEVVMN